MQYRHERLKIFEEICSTKNSTERNALVETFLEPFYRHENVFLDFLNKIFDDHLKERLTLRAQDSCFHLLPMGFQFDDPEIEDSFLKKLQF